MGSDHVRAGLLKYFHFILVVVVVGGDAVGVSIFSVLALVLGLVVALWLGLVVVMRVVVLSVVPASFSIYQYMYSVYIFCVSICFCYDTVQTSNIYQ